MHGTSLIASVHPVVFTQYNFIYMLITQNIRTLGNFHDLVSLDSVNINQQDLGGSFRPAQMTFSVNLVHVAITTRELSSHVSISSVLLDYRAISCK